MFAERMQFYLTNLLPENMGIMVNVTQDEYISLQQEIRDIAVNITYEGELDSAHTPLTGSYMTCRVMETVFTIVLRNNGNEQN